MSTGSFPAIKPLESRRKSKSKTELRRWSTRRSGASGMIGTLIVSAHFSSTSARQSNEFGLTKARYRPSADFVSILGGSQRPLDANVPTAYPEVPDASDPSTMYAPPETASRPYYPEENDPSRPYYSEENDLFHETVQDRVNNWRNRQREHSADAQMSPRDDQGRMKLLTSVSKGSRAIIFLVLMFRNIYLYEVADQHFTGIMRLFLVTPMVLLFISNLSGAIASFTAPSHASKKRLKAILNMDKLVEGMLILYSFTRLTIAPSKYTPREMYVSSILHSFVFILQCQAFTRLSWDDNAPKPGDGYEGDVQPAQQSNAVGGALLKQPRRDDGWYADRPTGPSNLFPPRRPGAP